MGSQSDIDYTLLYMHVLCVDTLCLFNTSLTIVPLLRGMLYMCTSNCLSWYLI